MGDLHLVLTALNLSTLNAGILIIMFSLLHVLPLAVCMSFFCWTSRGDHSEPLLLFEFLCGTPPSCFKVVVGWVGVVAHEILVSAQGPLVLGFWQQALTLILNLPFCANIYHLTGMLERKRCMMMIEHELINKCLKKIGKKSLYFIIIEKIFRLSFIIHTRTTASLSRCLLSVLTLYWDWILYCTDWGHLNV